MTDEPYTIPAGSAQPALAKGITPALGDGLAAMGAKRAVPARIAVGEGG
jgi:hypothetical protein